jgi:uncharacterized surface protein with fasciclin (FAS1) repeats
MKKNILSLLILFCTLSFAQTTHMVNAGSYYYSPTNLEINQGDIVVWINDGGLHDVNGETNSITDESFNNPETFNSPSMNTADGEIYSHVFNIPGIYNYDCSVGAHALNGMVGSVNVSPSNTVVDIIVNSDSHTILEAAVIAAELADDLSADGPFTVFAPTDEAFNALPAGTVDALLMDPTGDLANILLHHVYAGAALSTDLFNGMMIPTLLGTELTVSISDDGVMIDNAMVTVANIMADNGIVHVINAVLIPEVGCNDDDDSAAALASMFNPNITGCEDAVPYLASAGYPCNTDLTALGMSGTIADICECTCQDDNTSIEQAILYSQQDLLYKTDLLGRVINTNSNQKLVIEVYKSGQTVKKYILK